VSDYTSTVRIECDASPIGECELSRAQVEMIRKMELLEILGRHRGGMINAFYKPGLGWKITPSWR
jgi:hypothetical protein